MTREFLEFGFPNLGILENYNRIEKLKSNVVKHYRKGNLILIFKERKLYLEFSMRQKNN